MAYFSFLEKLYKNQPIQLFGNGELLRDFTYIDDIVDGIIKALEYTNSTKYSLFNL
jgi:UDP-glucuronate 4-epimerase